MQESMNVDRELSNRVPTGLMQFVLMSLAALEGADNQLLGASLAWTIFDLNITWDAISWMTVVQGVAANIMAPIWGVLADRKMARKKDLMIIAAIGQGVVTIILAFSSEYGSLMLGLRFLNGAFLAGLRPIANGVVASETSTHLQGTIFSRVFSAILAGGAICGAIVTPMAGWDFCILGYYARGWRVAWTVVGFLSVAAAGICSVGMQEDPPPPRDPNLTLSSALVEEAGLFVGFLSIPSFVAMVMQGIFGTIPWTVIWMVTRYYQLCGISSEEAGALAFWNPIGGITGVIVGGILSDKLVAMYGFHGRPLTAQLTVALGVPFQYLNFYGIAPGDGSFWIYLIVNFLFGLVASWAQGGCNWPVLAQIVPEETRSRVLALEGALENSLAAMIGPRFVGYLAENVFGFSLDSVQPSEVNLQAAKALGGALMITCCTPWLLAFMVYSVLHWAVPRDIARVQATNQTTQKLAVGGKRGSQMLAYVGGRQSGNLGAGL